jgi:tRNA (guanine37-N1)-methyltransferase
VRFDIFTLFPGMFDGPFAHSIVKRAIDRGLAEVHIHDIRRYATDRHHTADDYSFGGGPGMVMKPGPIFAAVEDVLARWPSPERRVVLLTPQGRLFRQAVARELSAVPHLLLLCGHYEGVDERVRRYLVDDEISTGDYVLTGGEIPAMTIVDAVLRLRPGVLHDATSTAEESHSHGLLEYPQYTRPADFRGWGVPPVLLGGNHARIAAWRRRQSLLRTWRRRPDLLVRAELTPTERALVAVWEGWAAAGHAITEEDEA